MDAELAEIDENLIRNDLTVLERGEHLARRKELYELKYPEAKRGGDRGNQHTGGRQTEINSFSQDTANKTGQTDRTIRQEVQIANNLTPEVKETIRGTDLADTKTELIALARLDKDEQKEAVAEVQSGKTKSISEFAAKKKKKKNRQAKIESVLEKTKVSSELPTTKFPVILK